MFKTNLNLRGQRCKQMTFKFFVELHLICLLLQMSGFGQFRYNNKFIESSVHFFLHCPNFTTQRQTLLNKLKSINASIMTENENSVVRTLLFGRPDFSYSTNKEIINLTISFILTTERFNCPLF